MPRRPLRFDPIVEARRQWEARGWGEPQSMAAVTSIMRAQQLLLGRIDALLRPLDLSFARYEILVLLSFSRRGALPLGKVGERLQVHPTSVTSAIDRLERQGFVRRSPHPTDRRATLAEITPAGRAILEQATPVLVEARFGIADLTARQLDVITSIIRRLRRHASDFVERRGA